MTNASPLPILSAVEFEEAEFPPRPALLDPILSAGSIGLIHGPAGIGKSFLTLGIAWAVASGGSFLGWRAPRPHKVLYIEGEMTALEMRRRAGLFGTMPPGLSLCVTERNTGPRLDLARLDGLERLMATSDDAELILMESLASLTGVVGNDPESWGDLRRFLAMWRRRCQAVLMVHNTNRLGEIRGGSRREDMLDLVLGLRRPADWRPVDGARFEIHFEKARSIHGSACQPIVAHLRTDLAGGTAWHAESPHASRLARAVPLLRQGMSAEAMGKALGFSPASAYRLQSQARRGGLVPDKRIHRG
jgi:putative DNA primase/helicase